MKNHYTIIMPDLTKHFLDSWCPDLIEVTSKSPKVYRNAVEQCARYFLREGYSMFMHYSSKEENDANCIAYLLCDMDRSQVTGACCFRLREYGNIPQPFWTMHWAWLHPYKRHDGILSTHIEEFNRRFGYWFPEMPHSKAMTAFIKKNGLVDPVDHFRNIQQEL